MVNKTLIEHIAQFLVPQFEDTDMFLVDIKGGASGKIEVFIDCESKNISIDKCAKISRYLESQLEENNLVGEKYVLEVSSPGMGNPFKVKQQYAKSIGREIKVLKTDNERVNGILKSFDENAIQVETHKKLKKKVVETKVVEINFEDIKEVKKKISFK